MGKRILVLLTMILLGIITAYRFEKIYDNPMERWDEETNVNVLHASDNFFPVLYIDNQPFFEKPPLWYWINHILFQNPSLYTARAFSSLCGITIILFTVYLSAKWWGEISALITWATLISTNHLFVKNAGNVFSTHTFLSADLDSLQILFILFAFFCLTLKSHFYLYIAAIICGLAILVKGPLGMLPFVSYFLFSTVNKRNLPVHFWYSLLLMILVILPWYFFMTSKFGWIFWNIHIIYHVTIRTIQPIEGHHNPFWYYGTLLINPKVFPAGIGVFFLLVTYFFKRNVLNDFQISFTFTTMLLLFIIPTLMGTRLAWYILPFYPFAALFLGYNGSKIISFLSLSKKSFLSLYLKSLR